MRIKVTGYLKPENDEIDESDETGLTGDAYEKYSDELSILDNLVFIREYN